MRLTTFTDYRLADLIVPREEGRVPREGLAVLLGIASAGDIHSRQRDGATARFQEVRQLRQALAAQQEAATKPVS